MNTFDKVNELSQSEFVKIFENIFEKARWIAVKLYDQKPFDNFDDLSLKMLKIFRTADKEIQLKILNSHPNLANKTQIGSLSRDSKMEQKSVGLNKCTEEEYNEFKNLNERYKKKFGFPFIIAVKDMGKEEILNEFKKRILNSNDDEFIEAIKQVIRIANLRLNELNIK